MREIPPPLVTRADWRAARECVQLGPPRSTTCQASDVAHSCGRAYGHHGKHGCRFCAHEWDGPLGATNRPASHDNDLCFAKRGGNLTVMELGAGE